PAASSTAGGPAGCDAAAGGGAPPFPSPASSCDTSSPWAPMSAIVVPTSTSPSATTILSRTPPESASTSCVTLSVSSSYSGSPFSTVSPSVLSQRTIVPASMPWPDRGGLTSTAISSTPYARATVRLIASRTSAACGTTHCSITGAKGSGANFAPT